MAKKSNYNQRTRDELKKRGYTAIQKVEVFNSFTKRMTDLYGVWDYLAVGMGETIAVQVTSRSNLADRARKIADSAFIGEVREAGWRLELWGYDKYKGSYRLKVIDVS